MIGARGWWCVAVISYLLAVGPPANAQKPKAGTKKKAQGTATTAKPQVRKLTHTTPDGAYEGDGGTPQDRYRTVAFTKRGSRAAGYAVDPYSLWCFQGTIDGNVIRITDAAWMFDVYDDNGRKTGGFRFEPLSDDMKEEFSEFRMTTELYTFPRRSTGMFSLPPSIIERDERWMRGCVQHYGAQTAEAPCGDEALRGTDEKDGTPKYRDTSTVCTITKDAQHVALIKVRGGVCSVQNVFDVLIRTPSAIAPTIDDEQAVENCGVLKLMSVSSPNEIKVEIDRPQHRVLNYTLPGHKFYPGRVIRQIVEENGDVKVVTTGTGQLAWLKNVENKVESVPIWLAVDQRLKVMFARAYKADE